MKKYAIAFFSILLFVGAVAFTPQKQQTKASDEVWFFTGSSTSSGELLDAGNYSQNVPNGCGISSGKPCQIHFDTQQYTSLEDYLDAVRNNQTMLNVDSYKP